MKNSPDTIPDLFVVCVNYFSDKKLWTNNMAMATKQDVHSWKETTTFYFIGFCFKEKESNSIRISLWNLLTLWYDIPSDIILFMTWQFVQERQFMHEPRVSLDWESLDHLLWNRKAHIIQDPNQIKTKQLVQIQCSIENFIMIHFIAL